MKKISIPDREQVSADSKVLFDELRDKIGFVPNVYKAYALSENGLARYLSLSTAKTSLSAKEKEAINLVVSQVNGCRYCQSAHSVVAKMNGFTDEEILEMRAGSASFDTKIDALVKFGKLIAEKGGEIESSHLENFFAAGYNKGNLVDLIIAVGERTMTNNLNRIIEVPIDFPIAPKLETVKI
jgi:uncharacterized peroxidase-related enzyme